MEQKTGMDHSSLTVTPVEREREREFQQLMQEHHYLGALRKIGNTIRYVAAVDGCWLGLLSFSAPALKCAARDEWIGWSRAHCTDRLKLVANNSRFLILPGHHYPNLASRILSRCRRRVQRDWLEQFSQPLLVLETFVDPTRHRGTIYRAANWTQVGATKGYRRTGGGYSARTESVKWVFVQALQRDARRILSAPLLDPRYRTGVEKMELTCNDMRSLYDHFTGVPDVRRAKGRKHNLANVLALAAGATLSGMRGYKDIWVWASTLSQASRTRFRCRFRNRRREVPSLTVIRNVMIQVGPEALDRAINNWLAEHYGDAHESIAVDGKTMRGAVVDNEGQQVHVMSAVGHDSKHCYTHIWTPPVLQGLITH